MRSQLPTLTLCGALLFAPAVRAQRVAGEPPTALFWRALKNPGARQAALLVRKGRADLLLGLGVGVRGGREGALIRLQALDRARAHFEAARRLSPDDPEIAFLLAKTLSSGDDVQFKNQAERRQKAIAEWLAVRALDTDYHAYDVAFELGLLYTLTSQYERAGAEYERALAQAFAEDARSALLANWAEVTMGRGDLERAVLLYEQAVEEATDGAGRALARLGHAVALDRLGERSEAMVSARAALKDNPRAAFELHRSGVFFVPAYEVHYYEALAHLAQAESEAGSRAQLAAVARQWERLIAERAPASFLSTARQQLLGLDDARWAGRFTVLRDSIERALKRAASEAQKTPRERGPLPEAQVLTPLLNAVHDFARFLRQGGERGPYGADAQAHLDELMAWLSGPS